MYKRDQDGFIQKRRGSFLSEELIKEFKENNHSSDKFKKPSNYSFSNLPQEIIMIILRKLDLRSLCRMSGVNKRFNNLAQNHLLYTSVNLEPYYWIMNIQAFHYLAPRCKYLRRLNCSNCVWISDHVGTFLVSYGSLLTHLKLAHLSIDNNTILTISEICKSLKELHLFNCYSITDIGFSYLENLKFLEYLNVGKTHITTKTLCKILRRNIRMRHLLILGTYDNLLNADEVVIELRNSCPDLESIKLGFMITPIANNFTSKGINAFADCKNLRGVHLDSCYTSGDSFFRVFSSCQHLERVFLSYIKGLTERDLRALTLCKNLKVLHLTCISMSPEICSAIFMNCHKLETVHFNRCNIADYLIVQWQQKYTRITIRAEKWPRPVESYIKTLITSLT